MVLIIYTKNASNLTNRYWDMVPDGRSKVPKGKLPLQLYHGVNLRLAHKLFFNPKLP